VRTASRVRALHLLLLAALAAGLVPRPAAALFRDREGTDLHQEYTLLDDLRVHRMGWGFSRNFDRGRWGVSAPFLFASVASLDGTTYWSPTCLPVALLFVGSYWGARSAGLPEWTAYWPLVLNGQAEWNPTYRWKLFLGTHTDLLFAEEEDRGLIFLPRIGLECRLGVVRLGVFATGGSFWSWDGPDRHLGPGLGVRLSGGRNR
jgi:hypothetical protein